MAGVKFTTDQQKAIDTLDKSVLVSAAAGSGKTAVLVERIINIILQGKANVDEMLVVTFTNAAASEMKLKLTKAIKKKIKEDPSSEAMLSVQLERMYRAYISTFHSLAMRIIKEFFYKIDMEPNFQICDEVLGTILQMEAIDELFEECFDSNFESGGVTFKEFLRRYSGDRNEDTIKSEIIGNYHKLRSMPNYMEWAYDKVEQLNVSPDDYMYSFAYKELEKAIRNDIAEAYNTGLRTIELLTEYDLPILVGKITPEVNAIGEMVAEMDDKGLSDDLLDRVSSFATARMVATKAEKPAYEDIKDDVKAYRDKYKDTLKNLKTKYIEPSLEVRFSEMGETYKYARYYLDLIGRFEEIFAAKKAERNVLDFSDIEHVEASILEDPEVADIVRRRFKYIFIDEYQDTNKLQEYLISRFARPDNVFKVGDVKQSIYGFRQSDPKIFMRVREEYRDENNALAETIDLNMNFRSNAGTIAYVNEVFEQIMPGYDDDAKLYNGLVTSDPYDFKPEIHIVINQNEDDSDDDKLTSSEAEAAYTAKLIDSIIGTEFYDSKEGVVRKATARDIVILMQSTKSHADTYYKALLEYNIAAHVNDEEGYFDTIEIESAMALLRVIDNMKQDVPLIAVLKSDIFGFTPEELADIRATYREAGANGSYHSAFDSYIETMSNSLADKARNARDKILEWKTLANMMPLNEFVWHVLTDSELYLYAGAMYGGNQRQANLRVLAERAGQYQDSGVTSLGGFIRYMDQLKSRNVKTGQAIMVSEEDDVVRIMTIHKSKGLEFPFVIVAGIGRRLQGDSVKKGMIIDPDVGVGISYVDRENKFWRPTIMQRLINDKAREDAYQEDIRVLYVAMTRARQKLVLTGTVKDEKAISSAVPGRSNYLDFIRGALRTKYNEFTSASAQSAASVHQVNMLEHFLTARNHIRPSDYLEIYNDVNRRLNYEYPNRAALETKAKYSVSELRALKEDRNIIRRMDLTDPEFRDITKVTGAEIGTGYHRIMESLDFRKVINDGSLDSDYIRTVAEALNESGAIDDEVYGQIRLAKVEKFFESEIGKRAVAASKAGTLSKEKPFTMRTNHDGYPVLVQGIIDCCFVENDKYVLIDYKSNYVGSDTTEVENMYREQLVLYKQALELGSGIEVEESYLYLFGSGRAIKMEI